MGKLAGLLLAFFFLTQSALAASPPIGQAPSDTSKPAESPVVSLQRVIDILESQARDLRQGLVNLSGLKDGQKQRRQAYLMFLDGALDYYESLQVNDDGSNVKVIANEIKSRRQNNYQAEIRKISDFVLVYQAMNILRTAEKRFTRIDSDLERLIGLAILKAGKPEIILNDAHASLAAADSLMNQAETLLDARAKNETLRFLISDAIKNIRQAYKDFFAISHFVAANTNK